MSQQRKAYVYGLATALCWSTVATAFKLSLRHLDPFQLLLYASLVSWLVLLVLLTFSGRLGQVLTCTPRQYLRSLVLGIMNPCLYYLVLFQAYDLLPAQEAQPLNYTWAVTLTLLSIPLLGQKIRAMDLVSILVCYAGVVVIATRGDVLGLRFSNAWGVALALGSTVIWALYWIANTGDDRDPVLGLFLNFTLGLPFVAGACVLCSSPWPVNLPGLLGAAWVGVFEMGLTFVLWLKALRLSENTAKVGVLIFLSPPLSLFLIHVLVGEAILPSTLMGLGCSLAGLALRQLGGRAG